MHICLQFSRTGLAGADMSIHICFTIYTPCPPVLPVQIAEPNRTKKLPRGFEAALLGNILQVSDVYIDGSSRLI